MALSSGCSEYKSGHPKRLLRVGKDLSGNTLNLYIPFNDCEDKKETSVAFDEFKDYNGDFCFFFFIFYLKNIMDTIHF